MGRRAASSPGWEKHMSSSKTVVTIKGSVMPSVVLPRGATKTVVLTDRIQRLIDRGFVTVVETHTIKDAPAKKAPAKKLPTGFVSGP